METELKTLISEILEIDDKLIGESFGPDDCDTWDSLNNLRMITAIESEFSIEFTMDQIHAMTTFGRIVDTIQSQQKRQ